MNIPLAILAAVAMFLQDSIAVVEVQAEAKNKGWIAGFCDLAKWIVGITCTTIAVTALQGNSFSQKVLVVVLVGAANVFGTKTGQLIGEHYFGGTPPDPMLTRNKRHKPR